MSISDDEVEAARKVIGPRISRKNMLAALSAAAKVRAIREGDGEWAAKAERYFLRLQAVYDQPHEDNPDWTNLGVALKRIREAASPIPATGGEKE